MAQGLHQADDAEWLVLGTGEANLRGHDFTVQAVLAFFTLTAVTKFSSDGSILLNIATKPWRLQPAGTRSKATF